MSASTAMISGQGAQLWRKRPNDENQGLEEPASKRPNTNGKPVAIIPADSVETEMPIPMTEASNSQNERHTEQVSLFSPMRESVTLHQQTSNEAEVRAEAERTGQIYVSLMEKVAQIRAAVTEQNACVDKKIAGYLASLREINTKVHQQLQSLVISFSHKYNDTTTKFAALLPDSQVASRLALMQVPHTPASIEPLPTATTPSDVSLVSTDPTCMATATETSATTDILTALKEEKEPGITTFRPLVITQTEQSSLPDNSELRDVLSLPQNHKAQEQRDNVLQHDTIMVRLAIQLKIPVNGSPEQREQLREAVTAEIAKQAEQNKQNEKTPSARITLDTSATSSTAAATPTQAESHRAKHKRPSASTTLCELVIPETPPVPHLVSMEERCFEQGFEKYRNSTALKLECGLSLMRLSSDINTNMSALHDLMSEELQALITARQALINSCIHFNSTHSDALHALGYEQKSALARATNSLENECVDGSALMAEQRSQLRESFLPVRDHLLNDVNIITRQLIGKVTDTMKTMHKDLKTFSRRGSHSGAVETDVIGLAYATLELPLSASTEDIKAAFKKKALCLHPDKNPDHKEEYEESYRLFQEAYFLLTNH